MPSVFLVHAGCRSVCLILHDFIFELNMLSLDLFLGVFCVFIVFRSALCLILDWMIAMDWFFDLVSALIILRENQLPNKRPDHNWNFQQKSPRRDHLEISEKVKISLTHAFLQFHIIFLYLPKKHYTLHFSVSAISQNVNRSLRGFHCQS